MKTNIMRSHSVSIALCLSFSVFFSSGDSVLPFYRDWAGFPMSPLVGWRWWRWFGREGAVWNGLTAQTQTEEWDNCLSALWFSLSSSTSCWQLDEKHLFSWTHISFQFHMLCKISLQADFFLVWILNLRVPLITFMLIQANFLFSHQSFSFFFSLQFYYYPFMFINGKKFDRKFFAYEGTSVWLFNGKNSGNLWYHCWYWLTWLTNVHYNTWKHSFFLSDTQSTHGHCGSLHQIWKEQVQMHRYLFKCMGKWAKAMKWSWRANQTASSRASVTSSWYWKGFSFYLFCSSVGFLLNFFRSFI